MIDGVHALADGVGQLELAQDGGQQHVHVLLGKPENLNLSNRQKKIDTQNPDLFGTGQFSVRILNGQLK